ncbi:MAG: hypothetical protein U1E28_18700 [Beijerinckiaceae bacterium]
MKSTITNSGSSQFPRTADLPAQSPLFWVEQKDRYLRQLLIRDIQQITGRRLLVYFANRYEATANIDDRDCSLIAEIFGDIGNDPVDLMIETNGGSTDATDSIITFLRNVTTDLRVIVANSAKSNGTLIALLAKSIVMGPQAELGPIEPSVQGVPASILTQPQVAATNFPLHMFGKYALQHSRDLATTLLKNGMMAGKPDADVEAVVEKLATRQTYASHGSSIDYNEALQLGLKIDKLGMDDELWKRIWLLHCMYDYDCRKSGYLKVFEGPAKSTAVARTPSPATP